MARKEKTQLLLLLVFLILSLLPFSYSELNSPQNIETFFPLQTFPVKNPNLPLPNSQTSSSSSSDHTIAKAVGITAACTLLLAGIFFFFLQKYTGVCNRPLPEKKTSISSVAPQEQGVVPCNEFKRFDGNLKGLIVDENGLDVLYLRKLEKGHSNNGFSKENGEEEEEEPEDETGYLGDRRRNSGPIQEVPLLGVRFVDSSSENFPQGEDPNDVNVTASLPSHGIALEVVAKAEKPPAAPPQPPLPPPIPAKSNPPPRPPPIPAKKGPPAPPPPLKKGPPAPPPPLNARLSTSSKPPPAPNHSRKEAESPSRENGSGQTKLKPLHWDKVTTNVDHSMVWHKINNGSFRFDGDLMEAMFGYVATNRKPPGRTGDSSHLGTTTSDSSAQIFILDPRKSQNIAIVLRTLAISRQEILGALLEGRGLYADTLEKLARIAPTKEEEAQIVQFSGDPTKLADVESFLFHILKSVPSAFDRLDSLLFRSNYDHEILQVKQSIQTLESACKELRTRGLFVKLLEAILKAGNRMNAGTTRGNAQAFNLTALRKLSDVKSTDGSTTLLHFVVEEVVRYEGKRCLINRNYSLGRSNSRKSNSSVSQSAGANEDKEEYVRLGLPVVGGLSVEFSNVKKSAKIGYDALVKVCPVLKARVDEIRQFLGGFNMREGGGFVRDMKEFLKAAEEELKVVEEEQTRVMELVKKTTQYYQSGASKAKDAPPLQLFEIVKDFLDMVDQACVDIARNQQKKEASSGSSSPASPAKRVPVKFPLLPEHFLSGKSSPRGSASSSSDSDGGGS
ncbi:formin-like protein 4 [Macadamia integrifolia]|uniref:formin-like protein 4 n=1 Tax=Macadamia integrifolia TaxID=60698 RepID=UPI001C4EE1A7|nr:formin-like protein 4 [Macadamia integrifolia]